MKLVLAITGASGQIYAKRLIEKLYNHSSQIEEVSIIFTAKGKIVWDYELEKFNINKFNFSLIDNNDFFSAPASGSADYSTMIICPASMGTIGRISSGVSLDLIGRVADVMLKEKRKLIVVPRETPLNEIHLANMLKISNAGAMILPASPSFYSKPKNYIEIIDTVIDRILKHAGLKIDSFQWK